MFLKGINLNGLTYKGPLHSKECPLIPASFVTDKQGTGFVHSAPAAGRDDFEIAREYDIPIVSNTLYIAIYVCFENYLILQY